jgi:hypothetical protein
MGIKLYSCSCFKNSEDFAIEVELSSSEKRKIKILNQPIPNINSNKKSVRSSSIGPEISKIVSNNEDESISDNNELKPLIKKINVPETLIQSVFRGYIFRKKFNGEYGIKKELIEENEKIIKSIENNFISKLILKGEKLYSTQYFEENWKKYYDSKEIDEIILKNNNVYINIKNDYLIKTSCLLSKYKKEDCLYKGTLFLNDIKRSKNKKKKYNINEFTGKGILYLRKGEKFEGSFINGELNGWCRYINNKVVCYEGLFINGILNGKGEIIKIDEKRRKHIYKGNIQNYKKEGKGIEKTSDFNYEGEFKNDMKNGKGKIIYNSGDCYEGEMTNDEITGKGFYTWKNKHTYFGDFIGGKMHGRGLYKWPDGNQYEGEYFNNIKEGQGEFKWKDGRVYKGPFENGMPHGKGVLTVNGITFDAIFDKGRYLGNINTSLNSPPSF